MKLKVGATVKVRGAETEYSSRWEIVQPLRSTGHRNSYYARNLRTDLHDQRVKLTVCGYENRLLGNKGYVDNVRRRLLHEAKMLTLPLNLLPEPVDLFTCENKQDRFAFPGGKRYSANEPVLVTEVYSGKPLDVLVGKDGALDEARALRIALKLCDLLEDLHRHGVLAYELRPEEILVDPDDHDRIWVLGCANYQRVGRGGVVRPAELVVPLSDFGFAAPEVEAGREALGPRTDIYALGAMLLFMLTGQRARDLRTGGRMRPARRGGHSARTRKILTRFLAGAPRDRFADTKRARVALRRALGAGEGARSEEELRVGLVRRFGRWLLGAASR
ncbi:MAG: hypothetical protein ACE5GW_06750 [Planctomycetota bacterium]